MVRVDLSGTLIISRFLMFQVCSCLSILIYNIMTASLQHSACKEIFQARHYCVMSYIQRFSEILFPPNLSQKLTGLIYHSTNNSSVYLVAGCNCCLCVTGQEEAYKQTHNLFIGPTGSRIYVVFFYATVVLSRI